MRIQNLAIIFIIIILPISLVIATYSQYQVKTINTQTVYDNKLTSATYDAIRAFQINTINKEVSNMIYTNSQSLARVIKRVLCVSEEFWNVINLKTYLLLPFLSMAEKPGSKYLLPW